MSGLIKNKSIKKLKIYNGIVIKNSYDKYARQLLSQTSLSVL